jgi:DNA-binding LacI/PurR family transcriptional regulator
MGERKGRPATSADVARESGVSRATVSYVLNDTPNKRISEATRRTVIETAKRLGHVPNPQAVALKTGSSNVVLCLVPALTLGYVFDSALDRLTRMLSEHGYALLINRFRTSGAEAAGLTLWRHVVPKLVVVIGNVPPADLEPIVAHSTAPLVSDFGIIDHRRIGRMQAEHLIGTGHVRLGFALPSDPDLRFYAEERLSGAVEACRAAGVQSPVALSVTEALDSHRAALETWRRQSVTGVCAHNDDVALILLQAMRQLGLRAPEDLAIVGSDDVPLAQAELTTVAMNVEVYAALLIDRVLDVLGVGSHDPSLADMLELVERTSA